MILRVRRNFFEIATLPNIFFSPNTSVVSKAEICQILHTDTEALSDKYLGLPALVGADRSDCFGHFVERIKIRLVGWLEKNPIYKRKGDITEIRCPSYTRVCYVCLQFT